MADRNDPIRNFRFKVQFGDAEAKFSEVNGFDISIDAIEYRNGDDPTTPFKLPGLTKFSNITFKNGITDSMEIYNWVNDCRNGTIERKEITITALWEDGSEKATWQLFEAWPVKYTGPDFNSTGSDVAMESIELAHEGLQRKS